MTIKLLQEAERPRERLQREGAQSLSLRECLAILLGTGPEGMGCMGLASRLLSENVSEAQQEEQLFARIEQGSPIPPLKGLGPAHRSRILVVLEIARRYARYRESRMRAAESGPSSPKDLKQQVLSRIPTPMRHAAKEWLGFVPLFTDQTLGTLHIVERGVRTHVNTDPTAFFAQLLPLHPSAFVLVHNHPSGIPTPSPDDYELTRNVARLAAQFRIQLIDHLVVSSRSDEWIYRVQATLRDAI